VIGCLLGVSGVASLQARILWSDPSWHLISNTNQVLPIPIHALLGQGDRSNTTLFFRFTIDPISDFFTDQTGNYEAGLVFSDKDELHLGIGNAWNAWGYSAFHAAEPGFGNSTQGEFDLNSEVAEVSSLSRFEPPRIGVQRTIVARVQYIPGENDQVTVWLQPDLSAGSSELRMTRDQTTVFRADASFDQILLSHRGGGHGWRMGNLAIATHFEDLTDPYAWQNPWFLSLALALASTLIGGMGWWQAKLRALRFQEERDGLAEQNALEQERKRIARDLHDELGATLSEISLLCSIAQSSKKPLEELVKIESRALRSVEALEEIVWSVDPKADSVRSFLDHSSRFAADFLSSARIRLDLLMPSVVMDGNLTAAARHNLFLAFKEALNNVVKHAQADRVTIRFDPNPTLLTLEVSDNGRGFCPSSDNTDNDNSQRHGLGNMRSRLASVGGSMSIDSQPNRGTTVSFRVPVRPMVEGP
jgi:signal transduction histidine kinase